MAVRRLAADWLEGVEPAAEGSQLARRRSRFGASTAGAADAVFPARSVAPSPTQLFLLRASLRALYDDNAPGMQRGRMPFGKRPTFDEAVRVTGCARCPRRAADGAQCARRKSA